MNSKRQVVVIQRVLPSYRAFLFESLSLSHEYTLTLIYGPNHKYNTKVRSDLRGYNYSAKIFLPAYFIRLRKNIFPYPTGLIRQLFKLQPSLIVCEGFSHPFALIKSILYTLLSPNCKLCVWTLGGLPQASTSPGIFLRLAYSFINLFADRFLTYSSFGRDYLCSHFHISQEKINVAVNISDTSRFLRHSRVPVEYIPGSFLNILCMGSIVRSKNLKLVVDIASLLTKYPVHFHVVGDGPFLPELRDYARDLKCNNITLAGRLLDSDLVNYLYDMHLLLLPGRGGMVISESMAFGIPALLYAADGVEFDLVKNKNTGFIVDSLDPSCFVDQIKFILDNPTILCEASRNSRLLISSHFPSSSYSSSFSRSILSLID